MMYYNNFNKKYIRCVNNIHVNEHKTQLVCSVHTKVKISVQNLQKGGIENNQVPIRFILSSSK